MKTKILFGVATALLAPVFACAAAVFGLIVVIGTQMCGADAT